MIDVRYYILHTSSSLLIIVVHVINNLLKTLQPEGVVNHGGVGL